MDPGRTTALLLLLVAGTLAEDGFNLLDAFDDLAPSTTPAKPKEEPKVPDKPKNDGGLDLSDALGPDVPATPKTKKPSSGDGDGGFGLDLGDALGPDPKPSVNPPKGGGGGGVGGGGGGGGAGKKFDDSDLFDVGGGGYKPDGGNSGKGGAVDPGYDPNGGAEEPQEAGSGKIAGIVSAIGVALLGAASSYIAYQKKKLCFKLQGGADPEGGKVHYGQQSDPQVSSNLLRTS